MLALSRFKGQSIQIGSDILISVVEVKNGKVKLAIAAPQCIPVHRFEIANRIQQKGESLVSLGAAVDSLEAAAIAAKVSQ